jgi:hypothetical protein
MASPLIEGRFGVGPSKESASKSNQPVPCVPCSLHAVGGVPSFSLSVQHGCPFPLRMDIVLTCRVFLAANVVAIASVKRCHLAKKTDVAEHPQVLRHVGLLVNGLPGTAGLPFI